ncbi:MAG: NAD(+) synthase [Spirochaetales bacterium]|nr:NAD(+) synthase [Spirochaetales bacterium]
MRLIKIGIATINTRVGAVVDNTEKIIGAMKEMKSSSCGIGCFHEQVIAGYPCEDFVQWKMFVDTQWNSLKRIAVESRVKTGVPTVFIVGLTVRHQSNLYNAAAVICNGKICGIVPKEKLPTYGVFYEWRTFSRGWAGMSGMIEGEDIPFGDLVFRFPFGMVGVEICEDIWSPDGPMRRRAYNGAEVIVNISASPFRLGIVDTRREMISTRAADNQVTLVYVNQYGGNDSLVFDGGGYVNQNGLMIAELPRWREGIVCEDVDLERTARLRFENTTWRTDCEAFLKYGERVSVVEVPEGPQPNHPACMFRIPENKSFFIPVERPVKNAFECYCEDLIAALICGLDYYEKTGVFRKIGISLSGGKDSTLSLMICYLFARKRFSGLDEEEMKKKIREFIWCFSMPAQYNSEETKNISRRICKELGVTFREIPIQAEVEREIEKVGSMLGPDEAVTDITKMNIQARIRGERMLNWSNSSGGMWIQTGNMSEKAVGYTTIGGDMMGAYSLIANIPKTVIIALLGYLYGRYRFQGLKDVLETKASAELADAQEDEKDLMPFPVLDSCMYLLVEEKKSPAVIYRITRTMWTDDELKKMAPWYKPGMLSTWIKKFVRLFTGSIFKWVQTPQAVHVGKLELDRERALQLPVVQSREWLETEDF